MKRNISYVVEIPKMFNGTNTILATKFGRQQSDYQRFFEQRSKSATGTVGFSTENLPNTSQTTSLITKRDISPSLSAWKACRLMV